MESREETGADGGQGCPQNHRGRVITYPRDQLAVEDGGDDDGEEHGEEVDAACYGGDAVDGLKPDGEVVDYLAHKLHQLAIPGYSHGMR